MSKIIGKYEFTDVTKDFVSDYEYGWLHLLPTVEYRHKYWYMWEFEFIFWKWWKKFKLLELIGTNKQIKMKNQWTKPIVLKSYKYKGFIIEYWEQSLSTNYSVV